MLTVLIGSGVVSVLTTLRAGRSGVRIPAGARELLPFQKTSRPAGEPTQPLVQWIPCSFPGGEAVGASDIPLRSL